MQAGFWLVLLRYLAGMVVLATVLWAMQIPLEQWVSWGWQQRIWHLLQQVIAGVVVYSAVLLVLGLRPRHLKMAA